jgi:hypothetical protein
MVLITPMNRRQIDKIDDRQGHNMYTIDDYMWNHRQEQGMSTMSTVYFVYDFVNLSRIEAVIWNQF